MNQDMVPDLSFFHHSPPFIWLPSGKKERGQHYWRHLDPSAADRQVFTVGSQDDWHFNLSRMMVALELSARAIL